MIGRGAAGGGAAHMAGDDPIPARGKSLAAYLTSLLTRRRACPYIALAGAAPP